MSGKYVRKKKGKKYSGKNPQKKSKLGLWIVVGILAVILLGLLALYLTRDSEETPSGESLAEDTTAATEPEVTAVTEETAVMETLGEGALQEYSDALDWGLEVIDIGKYTGIYMEDGTDEIVSGVLMLKVTNTGENAIQYAEILLNDDEGNTASFTLSTLRPGDTMVVLEQNRMPFDPEAAYTSVQSRHVAVFSEGISMHEDQLSIQSFEGAINIKNISGQDITGDIKIYYKNIADGVLYGGITYMARIEGGLAAGEIRQIVPSHYSANGSVILFVTIG